jgi:hypothetical protein
MATTVFNAFRDFAARLEPTEAQRLDASTKHTGIKDCLNGTLWVDRAFLTGSYARWTLVRPPNDVDLFVVLAYQNHGQEFYVVSGGAEAALQRIHTRLKACYPDTPIRKDHPSVRLTFASVGFDVVPAFNRTGGGFVIPSHTGSGWISTDPTKHAARTTAMNKSTGNYFVPIVKMFKDWNYAHFNKLTGFHLEMALAQAWPRVRTLTPPYETPVIFSGFAAAAAGLFKPLADQLGFYTTDPAGLSGSIDEYLSSTDRQLTRERLVSASVEAQIALRHEARGDHYSAITKWRSIFGDDFPAYG